MANPSAQLEVGGVAADYAYGYLGSVLLVQWRTGITLEGVQNVARYRNRLSSAGRLMGALHVAEEGMELPAAHVRAEAAVALSGAARASAIALVSIGSGFAASAVRSLGTALFALRGGPPMRMFATVPEGLTWLVGKVQATASHHELGTALEQLRTLPA
jgi:hypothetical protein